MTSQFRCRSAHTLMTAALLVLLVPFVAACSDSQNSNQDAQLDAKIGASLAQNLETISTDSLDKAILPGDISLQSISGLPVTPDSTPTVFYMGADYCPFCAAIRWPLVVALMRFGDFSGLKYMRSASDDVYPDTATFSFHDADYSSSYINLQTVELQDRERNPLENPNARQIDIFRKFDTQPYTSTPGAIPFLYLDGQYMQSGSPFNPDILKNLSWTEVAGELKKQESPLRTTILGIANLYTAAICKLTGSQPTSVCNSKAVTAAEARLPE